MPALPLAAATGLQFGDLYAVALLFVGLAVIAAVSALSHQHERAFSASVIYLLLGGPAATAIAMLDIPWLEPVGDHKVLERITEVALLAALFSTALRLNGRLTGGM